MTVIRDTKLEGLKTLIASLKSANAHEVYVGVPASKNTQHQGGPINMATLAAVHNFGSPARGIPERPFLTQAIIEGKDKISGIVAEGVKSYLNQGKEIDLQFYDRIGLFASNLVKDKILRGPFKELSDATKARRIKGSSVPLNDTGALRQSITFETK